MTRKVADLPACPLCGGRRLPLSLCDTCGVASIRRELKEVDKTLDCPDCGATNPSQVICDGCHARQPLADVPSPGPDRVKCPNCATFIGPEDPECPACGRRVGAPRGTPAPSKERKLRRIKGDYDETQLEEIRRICGIDQAASWALARRGYNAIWKLKRAPEADLARIPEIGPTKAREIVTAMRSLLRLPPRRDKEVMLVEEYECPLCRCPTSAFAASCLDCGAVFDEVEMADAVRRELLRDGRQGLLAFYDVQLEDHQDDATLWYARGLLLEAMGQTAEAMASLDRAANLDPGARKVAIARARLLSRSTEAHDAVDRLRSMLRNIVDEVALDQEMSDFQKSIRKEGRACPYCDEPLPPDAEVCPACSMAVGRAGAPAGPPVPAAKEEEIESLVKEISEEAPRVEPEPATPAGVESLVKSFEDSLSPEELEQTRMATVDWLMEELEVTLEEATEPPKPGPPVAKARRAVPKPEPAPAPAAREAPPPRPARPAAEATRVSRSPLRGLLSASKLRRGMINGAVNGAGPRGRARVNGLVNGRVNGFINGRGHVNGFINGKGYVNGAGVTVVRLPTPPRRTSLVLVAAGLAMVVAISGLLLISPSAPPALITIDGSFEDWAGVPALDAATASSDPAIEIARYAALQDRTALFLHAATRGPAFADPTGYDGMFFLLDTDGIPTTGYAFGGLGADYLVEVYGNASVVAARLYSFPGDAEINWSRRLPEATLPAAVGTGGIEVRLPTAAIESFDPNLLRLGLYGDNFEGASSRSLAPYDLSGGHILLETRRLANSVGPGWTDLLEIRARAVGLTSPAETWVVGAFQLNATAGLSTQLSAESVSLTRDLPAAIVRVSVQAPGFFPGDVVGVEVLGATAPKSLTVVGEPVRAYVDMPGTTLRVDGLFAEWALVGSDDADPVPVNNSNVDIRRYGAATDGSATYFHVQVAGILLGGSVPQKHVKAIPGGGGGPPGPSLPSPRRTGEDILVVFLDINATDPAGTDVEGIRADYYVELRGQAGRVTSRAVYEWSSGWRRATGLPLAVEKNATAFEGSLAVPGAGNDTRMVFTATDWSGLRDVTAPTTVVFVDPNPSPPPPFAVTISVPEFELVLGPVAGSLLIGLAMRRRRRRA